MVLNKICESYKNIYKLFWKFSQDFKFSTLVKILFSDWMNFPQPIRDKYCSVTTNQRQGWCWMNLHLFWFSGYFAKPDLELDAGIAEWGWQRIIYQRNAEMLWPMFSVLVLFINNLFNFFGYLLNIYFEVFRGLSFSMINSK